MHKPISRPVARVDAREKTGGTARYLDDLHFEGMLHAGTLRSDRSHARIKNIRVPDLPEGFHIIDARDVPGMNRVKILVDDQPFFAEHEVRYVGEPILLLAGEDRGAVFDLLSGIKVEYEYLEPVFLEGNGEGLDTFAEYTIRKGNPEQAFREAADVFEGTWETGLQEQAYMEPQGVIGVYDKGRVTVYGSMQCPYYIHKALVQGFGWEEGRVRVVQTVTGGAFGGKEEYPSLIAGHAAFAAFKTGRPVKIVFDRHEDMVCTTKRHPAVIRIKSALNRDRVTGMEIDITLDGGAYAGLSSVVLQRAMFASTGVYRVDNVLVRGRAVRTNTVPAGAFRGFGGPQAIFAVEMHMHSLAERAGVSPLNFKKSHVLGTGDKTVTGGSVHEELRLGKMADRVASMSGYNEKLKRFEKKRNGNGGKRGIGLSLFMHGCAFTGSGERDIIKAEVRLAKRSDGSVEILVSSVEMGQGAFTALRKIVAETLDIPLDRVVYVNPDTDRVPDSGPTVASRTVMIVGRLLVRAAEEMKKRTDAGPFEIVRTYEQPPAIRWDQDTFKGDAYPVYSWGANVVEVEVDPVTYEIAVRGCWGVYDVGTPIDERILKGQIDGGVAQGLGYATVENMRIESGRLLQSNMTDYVIPTSLEYPPVESVLMETEYEYGPFGAKCAGELPIVGAPPALGAAVQNALGVRVTKLPVTPEYLLEAAGNED